LHASVSRFSTFIKAALGAIDPAMSVSELSRLRQDSGASKAMRTE
jgi:hypothetical protein